jgi:hypothetical protein
LGCANCANKVAVMLAWFSSGLPFLLTANTFGYWLRDEGTSLIAIGFISWVGFAYAFKVYWSPLVDRVDVPLLGRLGRRRGWMLFCQILVAIGLLGMASVGVSPGWADRRLRAADRFRIGHAGHRHRRLADRGSLAFRGGGLLTRQRSSVTAWRCWSQMRPSRRGGARGLADFLCGHGRADGVGIIATFSPSNPRERTPCCTTSRRCGPAKARSTR